MVTPQASSGSASVSAAPGSGQEKQPGLNENGAAPTKEELSGPMLAPSAFNKNWVYLTALLQSDAVTFSRPSMSVVA